MLKSDVKGLKKASSEVVATGDDYYNSDNSGLAPPFTVTKTISNHTDTTAQTIVLDDSFQEVTNKRSRREDKQMAKEKMQEDKVTKKYNAPIVKTTTAIQHHDTEEHTEEDEQTTSFENTQLISKKKQQYLEQAIVDRSGNYDYAADPQNYKKARKRLQNRESAVRSRLKKRNEMEVLEEEVRKLQQQKAAVESANDELKRQNKYWEDLFAKQQLQPVIPISIAPLASSTNTTESQTGFNSQSEFTRSDLSASGAESSHELSYTSMKMASDKGAKRQKRSDSMELGSLFPQNHSHELLEKDLDGTFENAVDDLPRQPASPDIMRRQLSIDAFNNRHNTELDDCFLERQPQKKMHQYFFGLAIIFGSIGAVGSMMGTSQIDASIMGGAESSRMEINSGGLMKSAGEGIRMGDSSPIKDGTEMEDMVTFEAVDSGSSAPENLYAALMLVLQAYRKLAPFAFNGGVIYACFLALAYCFMVSATYYFVVEVVFAKPSSTSSHSSHNRKSSSSAKQSRAQQKERSRKPSQSQQQSEEGSKRKQSTSSASSSSKRGATQSRKQQKVE